MSESPDHTRYQRAQGESLLKRLTVWSGLGAMVATGAVAALVAHALPGRTSSTPSTAAAGASSSGSGVPATSGGTSQPSASTQAPAPAVQPPVVTSGGS